MPRTRKWQPTPVFLSGKSHGQRSLAVYSPWGRKRVGHDLETKQEPSWYHFSPQAVTVCGLFFTASPLRSYQAKSNSSYKKIVESFHLFYSFCLNSSPAVILEGITPQYRGCAVSVCIAHFSVTQEANKLEHLLVFWGNEHCKIHFIFFKMLKFYPWPILFGVPIV